QAAGSATGRNTRLAFRPGLAPLSGSGPGVAHAQIGAVVAASAAARPSRGGGGVYAVLMPVMGIVTVAGAGPSGPSRTREVKVSVALWPSARASNCPWGS